MVFVGDVVVECLVEGCDLGVVVVGVESRVVLYRGVVYE